MTNNFLYRGQSAAESFALEMSNYKENGFYVELGAFHSKDQSNTFYLETDFKWKGLSLEINENRRNEFIKNRKNPCFGDALKIDYMSEFKKLNFPERIDFLQIDIDQEYHDNGKPKGSGAEPLLGLITLPLTHYRFNVIVFEHDMVNYYKNESVRDAQREILNALDYRLVIRDVHEDWWIDPVFISREKVDKYMVNIPSYKR